MVLSQITMAYDFTQCSTLIDCGHTLLPGTLYREEVMLK